MTPQPQVALGQTWSLRAEHHVVETLSTAPRGFRCAWMRAADSALRAMRLGDDGYPIPDSDWQFVSGPEATPIAQPAAPAPKDAPGPQGGAGNGNHAAGCHPVVAVGQVWFGGFGGDWRVHAIDPDPSDRHAVMYGVGLHRVCRMHLGEDGRTLENERHSWHYQPHGVPTAGDYQLACVAPDGAQDGVERHAEAGLRDLVVEFCEAVDHVVADPDIGPRGFARCFLIGWAKAFRDQAREQAAATGARLDATKEVANG